MLPHLAALLAGSVLVVGTLASAIETVVVPRAYQTVLSRLHFTILRLVFKPFTRPSLPFDRRDRVMALYAPIGLVLLPGLWAVLVVIGFTAIFWGAGVHPITEALVTSGSSLLTLGFVRPASTGLVVATFVEAVIGLGLISLMISYLPTIYGAFSRRESLVGMLEVRAGLPPSTAEMLVRYHRIGWLERIHDDVFQPWETWFVDIEESHTTQPSLVFFRSPHPERSWITAAGCVLDTAAIVRSTLAMPSDARCDVLVRSGFLTLRRIADSFGVPYDPNPAPTDTISIERGEFDELCTELTRAGILLRDDLDQAWADFVGWRVNYDAVLVGLCRLVMAPPARWSSDRVGPVGGPGPARRRRTRA